MFAARSQAIERSKMPENSGMIQTAEPANEYTLSRTKNTTRATSASAKNIPPQNAKRNGMARSVLPMENNTSIMLQANVHGASPAKNAIQSPHAKEVSDCTDSGLKPDCRARSAKRTERNRYHIDMLSKTTTAAFSI